MAGFRVTDAAQADIREIGRYTQQKWGKAQRRIYLNGLDERFRLLASQPTLAVERKEFDPPVRIHHYQSHMIIYVTNADGILIVRVLHRSMDVPGQLSRSK